MKRLVYAVITASAIGLAAGGIALGCEHTASINEQGAAQQKGKLALLGNGIAAPPSGTVYSDDDSKGGDNSGDNTGGDGK
jgi:hypothetical protein